MIINYLIKFTVVMVIALILYIIIRLTWLKKKNREFHWKNEWATLLFVSYLAALASLTIVPTFYWTNAGLQISDFHLIKKYNLVPFRTLSHQIQYFSYTSLVNLVGNVLLFIPIGFLAPFIWSKYKEWKNALILGLLVSGTIEIIQYFIGRSTDIDDVIVNTLAIMLGAFLYKKCLKKKG